MMAMLVEEENKSGEWYLMTDCVVLLMVNIKNFAEEPFIIISIGVVGLGRRDPAQTNREKRCSGESRLESMIFFR